MSFEYAIIVKNKTRLELLIERFNTKAQAKFYIEHLGGNFTEYEIEHELFTVALLSLQTQLSKVIKNKIIDRMYLPSFIFAENHIVVVIGQDGLVANTAKYANNCPIVAVNPDPTRYDGVLLPFNLSNFLNEIKKVILGQHHVKTVHFAEAKLNDGQRILAFNDLFIGAASHISARYKVSFDGKTEMHSSSGIIISTQSGSTGWLSSVFNMAAGVTRLFDENFCIGFPQLEEKELIFVVREPFKSVRTQIEISTGLLDQNSVLTIESFMPDQGVIFSDGIETDFLAFNSGCIAKIGIAPETAQLVIK